ncbi:hypothetical protein [Microbacterium kyungheense]|uniref:Uncharacterized protein n=1 Tax=Microbacterium kyungheense TaxID=1263636 RepID=A0A543FMB1_9MICO|nr:hypothetical protein [Microbacterium kyungheense]TQM34985.1 hypothetical protein FB391_1281 [Microbacterium kyungheense]
MGVFSKFRRGRTPYRAATDEERIARYVYLLGTLPASVIESAHATAFADLPPARRRELFEQLRPFLSESERDAAAEDPTVIARLVRRAEHHRAQRAAARAGDAAAADGGAVTAVDVADDPRDRVDVRSMLRNAGVMVLVADQFLVSSSIAAYYTVGAGSLQLDAAPAWVGETYDSGAAGVDAGGFGGGLDGGSYDGGGVGGFDGGFGGGFDGGGGFGG